MPVATRRGLAAWPIRRKLVALVAGPLVVLLLAGIFFTAQSISSLRASQRARDLANAALLTNHLVTAIDNELKATLDWRSNVAVPGAKKEAMLADQKITDTSWNELSSDLVNSPGGAWSDRVTAAFTFLTDDMSHLSHVRIGAQNSNGRYMIQSQYTLRSQSALNLLTLLTVDLSGSTPSATTVDAAATIHSLALASDAAAQESVGLGTGLLERRISDRNGDLFRDLKLAQALELDQARATGTQEQKDAIDTIRSNDAEIEGFRADVLDRVKKEMTAAQLVPADDGTKTNPVADKANAFASTSWARVTALDALVNKAATATRDQADVTARNGLVQTGLVSAIAVVGLLLGFALVAYIARTVTGPMRRLRAGAVDAATVRLPAMVRQIEREGSDALVSLPAVLPPGTVAGPETLEVAQAVDGLTAEAVRLATAQVRLRHALDEAFVSMSRRSQSMVEKQLAIIDELESTEEDPEQLRNLFRLDHLAARMRRYNDNLLVLAGSTLRTRSAAPVPIADVFRAATSEMEQYERVRLQPVNGVAVSGPVAGGLVHLLAELLDNAAMYSPPTSPILLSGALTADGGLHLEITDSGVGIPASELADLNTRLATPGSIDTQVPSRMGLYVVARLAQRGSFSVRLSPRANAAGTVAEVNVPAAMVVGSGRPGMPGQTGQPGQGPGGSPRPDAPRLPGSPEPGRVPSPSPAMSGGMRLDPALRLTSRPGGATATSPRGIPAHPAGPTGPGPTGPVPTGPGPTGPPAPGGPNAAPGGPPAQSPLAPAASTATAPTAPVAGGRPANGVPGGLPSRRPGAALASNPLAVRPGGADAPRPGFEAFGGHPPAPAATGPGSPAGPAAAPAGGVAAARAGMPAAPPAPSATPLSPPAPSRSGADPLSAPELSVPTSPLRSASGGLAGGLAGRMMPPPAPVLPAVPVPAEPGPAAPTAPAAFATPPTAPPAAPPQRETPTPSAPEPAAPVGPRFEAPLTSDLPRRTRGTALSGTPLASGRPVPTPLNGIEAAQMFGPGAETVPGSAPIDQEATQEETGSGTPLDDLDVTRPPIRPFAQPRPATDGHSGRGATGPARPPFRPGASSAQAGASAATAAAAAARARAAASGRVPTPGTGLFAATGPATLPGGIVRPPASVPTGPNPTDRATGPRVPAAPAAFVLPAAPAVTPASFAPPAAPAVTPEPVGRTPRPVPTEPARPAIPMAPIPPLPSYGGELDGPMTGLPIGSAEDATPIFDSISAWFATEPTPEAVRQPSRSAQPGRPKPVEPSLVIDLRDDPATVSAGSNATPGTANRWAALGDQRWLATNARAAADPEIAGNTEAGLPRRQPGANLLPSAVEAAPGRATASLPATSEARTAGAVTGPAPATGARPDADAVRGRLGSYQRGLTTARRARHLPGTGTTRQALGESESRPQDAGRQPGDQGGNQ